MKSFLFLLFLALTTAAPKSAHLNFLARQPLKTPNTQKLSSRIIGGQEAVPHSLPYVARLVIYSNKNGRTKTSYGGGSLISHNYVITAAHCVRRVEKVEVVLGAHNLPEKESSQLRLMSTEFIIHEEHHSTFHDIALIKLPKSVTFNDAIQPINLPSRADVNNNYAGELAVAAGWGRTGNSGSSAVLIYTQSRIVTPEKCARLFAGTPQATHICIVSDDLKSGACYGDSGGPLVTDGTLVGVFSFMVADCRTTGPSGFTRVTSYLDWIEANSDVVIN